MLMRALLCSLLTVCQAATAQDLLPDEASRFLHTASAKIKANCDAVKSWQAKVTAKIGKQQSAGEFTLAENGDWLLSVESSAASTKILSAEPAPISTHSDTLLLEYFFHGLTFDKAQRSAKGRRIVNQVPGTKTPAAVDVACPNPLCLFQSHQNRFDEALLKIAKSTLSDSFSFVVTKPIGAEKIWSLAVTKIIPSIRNFRVVETWRLDETQAFLPIFHQFKLEGGTFESTYEYEAVDGLYLPKRAAIGETSDRVAEFEVQTTSVNRGPKEVAPRYDEGDRLNDLNGKRFVFQNGAFKLAEGE